jgi:raffinose/stachyose/melibiose transport system permease protein
MAALPVQFAVSLYGTSNSMGLLFAVLIMCMIPVLLFYLCVQKMIIKGMTEGAVKG